MTQRAACSLSGRIRLAASWKKFRYLASISRARDQCRDKVALRLSTDLDPGSASGAGLSRRLDPVLVGKRRCGVCWASRSRTYLCYSERAGSDERESCRTGVVSIVGVVLDRWFVLLTWETEVVSLDGTGMVGVNNPNTHSVYGCG
jgi:hypothetical protein